MSKFRESTISNSEKEFLLKCLADHNRLDGRAFEEFRELTIEFGNDWGCCTVSLGQTRVLAQVSCEIQQPKSSRPSEGLININVELTPLAAAHFEVGRFSETQVQLNRILEKCIKDSKAVDLESLCIKVNEKVWSFRVDVNVLNYEGNIIDCASIGALTALAHFRRPDVTSDGENMIVHTYAQRDPIPTVLHHHPVCVSYAIFDQGSVIVADPGLLEENTAEAHLILGLNSYKELCGLHLGGSATMSVEDIQKYAQKGAKRAYDVVQHIKKVLEEDTEKRKQRQVVGFDISMSQATEVASSLRSLDVVLDGWRQAKAGKKARPVAIKSEVNDEPGSIESLGKGMAALIPNEPSDENHWIASSDEGSEEEIMETQPVAVTEEPKTIDDDDDSEEEAVIVLNANKQTSAKRKKR